ncbi:MAG: SigE family RNA polymerase sigma factor [Actinobacteria bacterium]|nr:SigE family RNA polymerase sigma factor [Actinomycetota bacterium]
MLLIGAARGRRLCIRSSSGAALTGPLAAARFDRTEFLALNLKATFPAVQAVNSTDGGSREQPRTGASVFEDFVAGRGQALQRFGYALTGDWALAEDLLQTSLARAYPHWSRVRLADPEAYVRRIMINTWSSWWRRRWRGELPAGRLPEVAELDYITGVEQRQALRSALCALPPRQRAVVVLRYHQDLSEAQVADLLGISVGTVKSQAAKALASLRVQAALEPYRKMATGSQAAAGGE